jgi:hypothetical protein
MARAYSGRLRTDRRALHRVVQVQASFFDAADTVALRAILNTPGPVLCGGTMIGDDGYFHVSGLDIQPIRSDLFAFSFELHETDDQPSVLLFSFDGDAFGPYSFSRTGAASYEDEDGVLQSAAANIARRTWSTADSNWALRMERAATNLIDDDDLTAWTAVNTPVVTGSVSDPAGGTGAFTVEDDSASVTEYVIRNITGFTDSALNGMVFVVRENTMPASGSQLLQLWDTTAGVARLLLSINSWTAGEPAVTATTGTYLGKRQLHDGYWAIYGQTTAVTEANTNRAEVVPAGTGTATGSIDVYRVNAYALTKPVWSVLNASQVLGAEYWNAPYTRAPVAATLYAKFRELREIGWETAGGAHPRIVNVGGGSAGNRLYLRKVGGASTYSVDLENDGSSASATVSLSPARGDIIELRAPLYADGSVLLGGSKNAAAESVSAPSSAISLPSAWTSDLISLGSVSATAGQADVEIINAKIITGEKTLDECRDIARGRLHPRQVLPL